MGPPRSEVLVVRDREIIQIFELIHSITECLATFDYNNLWNMSTERVQLSDSIYVAEWRLFQLEESYRNLNLSKRTSSLTLEAKNMGRGEMRDAQVIDLSESLVLAGHLFVHLALRGQPPAAARHRGVMEALVSSLCDTLLALDLLSHPEPYGSPRSYYSVGSLGNSSVESWSTTTSNTTTFSGHSTKREDDFTKNILLWILFIGSCVRSPIVPTEHFPHQTILLGDHHQFFIYALKKYCLIRHVTNKETLADKLKDVAWLNSWYENQLNLIWTEISDHLVP